MTRRSDENILSKINFETRLNGILSKLKKNVLSGSDMGIIFLEQSALRATGSPERGMKTILEESKRYLFVFREGSVRLFVCLLFCF